MVKAKYIVIALFVIAALLFAWWIMRKKSIAFDFNLGGNISDILSSVQSRYANPQSAKGVGFYVDVPLTTIITNKGTTATVLSNILGSISYNGEAIMQTKANSTVLQNVSVPAKSSTPVTDSVQLLINAETINFLSQLVQGKKPAVQYNFNTTILGKPYAFKNTGIIAGPVNSSQRNASVPLFTSKGLPLSFESNQKQKTCCSACLEFSHVLDQAVGMLPAGTKVYTCNKSCGCATFA